MIDLSEVFPGIDPEKIQIGGLHFLKTQEHVGEHAWRKEGTLYCAGTGRSRVGFAIRKGGCSWHFRDRDAVELYRAMDGRCSTSQVTIKFGFDSDPDYSVIGKVVGMALAGGLSNN